LLVMFSLKMRWPTHFLFKLGIFRGGEGRGQPSVGKTVSIKLTRKLVGCPCSALPAESSPTGRR
jgi:hypothetical protein